MWPSDRVGGFHGAGTFLVRFLVIKNERHQSTKKVIDSIPPHIQQVKGRKKKYAIRSYPRTIQNKLLCSFALVVVVVVVVTKSAQNRYRQVLEILSQIKNAPENPGPQKEICELKTYIRTGDIIFT